MVQGTFQSPFYASFEAFYAEDRVRLINFLVAFGAPHADAEDIVQEAMLSAALNWETASINPRPYVRTAVKRIYLRRKGQDQNRAWAEQQHLDAGNTTALFDEDTRHIYDIVRALPEAQREVIAWTIDGYKPAEIAEFTERAVDTMYALRRTARQAIRDKLVEQEPEEGRS